MEPDLLLRELRQMAVDFTNIAKNTPDESVARVWLTRAGVCNQAARAVQRTNNA